MNNFVVTPELLVSVSGVILSLLFSYIPGLRVKFAALEGDVKRLIMLRLIVAIALGVIALQCFNIVQVGLACNQEGIKQLVWLVILAIISNQSIYAISPLPADVKDAKLWKRE